VIDLDKKWRQLIFSMEAAKKEMNLITREIGKGVSKEVREELVQKASHAKQTIKNLEIACTEAKALCDKNLCKIGNLVHASVVKSNDEKNNKVDNVLRRTKYLKPLFLKRLLLFGKRHVLKKKCYRTMKSWKSFK
jgi:seryl-tRNA synthetase